MCVHIKLVSNTLFPVSISLTVHIFSPTFLSFDLSDDSSFLQHLHYVEIQSRVCLDHLSSITRLICRENVKRFHFLIFFQNIGIRLIYSFLFRPSVGILEFVLVKSISVKAICYLADYFSV